MKTWGCLVVKFERLVDSPSPTITQKKSRAYDLIDK